MSALLTPEIQVLLCVLPPEDSNTHTHTHTHTHTLLLSAGNPSVEGLGLEQGSGMRLPCLSVAPPLGPPRLSPRELGTGAGDRELAVPLSSLLSLQKTGRPLPGSPLFAVFTQKPSTQFPPACGIGCTDARWVLGLKLLSPRAGSCPGHVVGATPQGAFFLLETPMLLHGCFVPGG